MCAMPVIPNSYGVVAGPNVMLFDFGTMECWVDGSKSVPTTGCSNFAVSGAVDQRLINK